MTVCVAAICDDGENVVGVLDAMITTNYIETEPMQKIISLTRPILAMIGGAVYINTEILARIRQVIGDYDRETMIPYQWNVRDIAHLYQDTFLEIRLEKIEKEILAKYGFDLETWKLNQNTLAPQLVEQIIHDMKYFDMPNIEVIIAGVDKTGAHIFVIKDDEVTCRDLMGYGCIGMGGETAELEFIAKRHTPKQPFEQAILNAYLAKKESEKIVGVGKQTHYFFIVPEESDLVKSGLLTSDGIIAKLEVIHFTKWITELNTNRRLKRAISNFVKEGISGGETKGITGEMQEKIVEFRNKIEKLLHKTEKPSE